MGWLWNSIVIWTAKPNGALARDCWEWDHTNNGNANQTSFFYLLSYWQPWLSAASLWRPRVVSWKAVEGWARSERLFLTCSGFGPGGPTENTGNPTKKPTRQPTQTHQEPNPNESREKRPKTLKNHNRKCTTNTEKPQQNTTKNNQTTKNDWKAPEPQPKPRKTTKNTENPPKPTKHDQENRSPLKTSKKHFPPSTVAWGSPRDSCKWRTGSQSMQKNAVKFSIQLSNGIWFWSSLAILLPCPLSSELFWNVTMDLPEDSAKKTAVMLGTISLTSFSQITKGNKPQKCRATFRAFVGATFRTKQWQIQGRHLLFHFSENQCFTCFRTTEPNVNAEFGFRGYKSLPWLFVWDKCLWVREPTNMPWMNRSFDPQT